jgi:hypothetical protein
MRHPFSFIVFLVMALGMLLGAAAIGVAQPPRESVAAPLEQASTNTPTNTPVPPTATPTNTPLPPTATPTNTPLPPTATPTNTPVPPTATPTNTPLPPTATPTNTPGVAASIVVTPTNATLTVGGSTQNFQASVHDSSGNYIPGASLSWAVNAGAGSSVLPNSGSPVVFTAGTVAGVYPIGLRVTSGALTKDIPITLNPGPVNSVTINPTSATVQAGLTQGFSATAIDQYNNPVSTSSCAWASNDTNKGTVSPTTGSSTTFTAKGVLGTHTNLVTVTCGTKSASANVTITPGPVDSVTINPTNATVQAGLTQNFTAAAFDQFSNPVPSAAFSWQSTDTNKGTVSPASGSSTTFTAKGVLGTHNGLVQVTSSGKSASANVTITAGPVNSVTINPTSASVQVNGTQNFSASAFDQFGNPVPGASFSWQSTNTSRGTVSPATGSSTTFTAGTVAGIFDGLVQVSSSDKTANANITITPGPLASITLQPSSVTLPADETQSFTATALDVYGNIRANDSVNWSVNGSAGAITPTSALAATFRATTAPGTYVGAVVAERNGISAAASVTVEPGPLARIDIAPSIVSLKPSETQSFSAAGYDAFDNAIPNLSFTWTATPESGSIESSSALNATFRAGVTPGTYFKAVRATSGSVSGFADIVVNEGDVALVMLSPAEATVPINGAQLFTASVLDAYGNPIPGYGVTWQVPDASVGVIESSDPSAATFRAGTRAGTFDTAIVASNGVVSRRAKIVIPPGPPSKMQMTATPDRIQTNGVQASTIVITVTDAYGNSAGAGLQVTLSIDACTGLCTLGATSGATDARGVFSTTLTSLYNSSQGAGASQIIVKASATTGSGGTIQPASATIIGVFSPNRYLLPLAAIFHPPDNHTACTALLMTPPATVSQPANNAFNIYRFTATQPTYGVVLENVTLPARLLLYQLRADNCGATGSMTVSFVSSVNITSSSFQTTLSGFNAGSTYLLAVNVTGATSNQFYTITIRP